MNPPPTLVAVLTAWIALLVASLLTGIASAEVTLPPVFSDHAVLQRGVKLPVWGQAAPGEKVTVTLAGQTAEAVADEAGKWQVTFEPLEAVGPHEMTVIGVDGQPITLTNLLAGEVWILSGQSNMEWPVAASNNAEAETAAASYPQIRLLTVSKATASAPTSTMTGTWQVCTPQTVAGFSAVGYFMGRELHQELGVPIGLIDSSWGGTPIEPWMPASALESLGRGEQVAQSIERLQGGEAELIRRAASAPAARATVAADIAQWSKLDYNDTAWRRITLPGPLEGDSAPDLDGVSWYRLRIDVPAERTGQPAILTLGAIDDFDETFINGTQVGSTDNATANHWLHQRAYDIPAGTLVQGPNVIAIRMTDTTGPGGFAGPADAMHLEFVGDGDDAGRRILLAGEWRSAFESVVVPDPTAIAFTAPQNEATALYNAMIAPLEPLAVRGMAWYQGESNAGNPAVAEPYGDLLKGMIQAWRDRFAGDKPQPFLVVQLANFQQKSEDANQTDGWATLRDQQRRAADEMEKVGLIVTTDVGAADDIHPRDKQTVGHRLALLALRDTYGREIVAEGPRASEVKVEGIAIVIRFINSEGMSLRGDAARAFAISGAEGNFVWATATIEGDTIRLTAEGIASPVRVRHAWGINPNATLHNAQGLPAPPFDVTVP